MRRLSLQFTLATFLIYTFVTCVALVAPLRVSIRPRHSQARRQKHRDRTKWLDNHHHNQQRSNLHSRGLTRLQLGAVSIPSTLSSVFAGLHQDPSYCLTAILALSAVGIQLEKKSQIGKALSAPLTTMAMSLVLANLGAIPFQNEAIYTTLINHFLVPLAVPLLLFDSDLKRIYKDTGPLLLSFGVGAIATTVATVAAFPILTSGSGLADVWKVAAALCARHIGGAINFVAVAETLQMSGTSVAAAIAADNIVVALYFALLFAIARPGEQEEGVDEEAVASVPSDDERGSSITLSSMAVSLTLASMLVTVGKLATKALLPADVSSLPLISIMTVVGATMFPSFFHKLQATGTSLGIMMIQMFFAASGAAGSIQLVLQKASMVFAFSSAQIAIHFGVLLALGRGLFRLPARELYLASNANVGGPTTAAAMAKAKRYDRLVLPALLIGILGYASATGIALALCPLLKRMMPSPL